MTKYKVVFEFETDEKLTYPQTAVEDALDCEFDNLNIKSVEVEE